jgi:putative transposase
VKEILIMPLIRPELLDELLKDYQKPEDLLGQDGLLQQLTKALVERALDGELTHHLGYEKHDVSGDNSGNSRNGTTPKTMRGKRGQVQIDVPRDRASSFEPQLVKKRQTRFDGLDENIISLYARGMTQREIQGHLEEIYGVEISPSLISTVTDVVLDEVRAWQARPLDAVFKLMYLALKNISKRWTMPIKNWSGAMNQFAILFDGRVPMGGLNHNSLTQSA